VEKVDSHRRSSLLLPSDGDGSDPFFFLAGRKHSNKMQRILNRLSTAEEVGACEGIIKKAQNSECLFFSLYFYLSPSPFPN